MGERVLNIENRVASPAQSSNEGGRSVGFSLGLDETFSLPPRPTFPSSFAILMPATSLLSSSELPAPLASAIDAAPLPPLREGTIDPDLAAWLTAHPQLGFPDELPPACQLEACQAGLWLLAGDLDRSHRISQDLPNAEGSFWHGIMHRREGDYGNAKYWFRNAGAHPVFRLLGRQRFADETVAALDCWDRDGLDPFAFVDACQRGTGQGGELADHCRQVQWMEWQALFAHCLWGAVVKRR